MIRSWLKILMVLTGGLYSSALADEGDWPGWRGPNRNGIADPAQKVPIEWSETNNVLWKVPIPGRGHSSPTLVGNQIFLATADESRQTQTVLALDRATGKPLWQTEISRGGFPKIHRKNTHATGTIASDGERVFATFHHHNLVTLAALDLAGKILWKEDVGPYHPQAYEYGYAASPVIWESLVIVAAECENGSYLAALDRRTGEAVWKTGRPKSQSYSSPVVARVAGREQLLISGQELVSSYDPNTGAKLWSAPGTTMATCGTMVWNDQLVFASGGYPKAETIAVKADGSGEVVWKNRQKCYEQSMLVHNGHVYGLNDSGIAFCLRATDGELAWQHRLAGPVSASPVLVGDVIYQSIENGTTFVFRADPQKFELLAKNQLGDEAFATPTICGNRIYLRTAKRERGERQEYLYCLESRGKEEKAAKD